MASLNKPTSVQLSIVDGSPRMFPMQSPFLMLKEWRSHVFFPKLYVHNTFCYIAKSPFVLVRSAFYAKITTFAADVESLIQSSIQKSPFPTQMLACGGAPSWGPSWGPDGRSQVDDLMSPHR
jgi:hypothetical protein